MKFETSVTVGVSVGVSVGVETSVGVSLREGMDEWEWVGDGVTECLSELVCGSEWMRE